MADPVIRKLTRDVKALEDAQARTGVAIGVIQGRTQRASTQTGSLSTGSTDVTLTWPQSWPDGFYWVGIELQIGDGAYGNVEAHLKPNSKTAVDFVVRVKCATTVATVAIDCVGIRT